MMFTKNLSSLEYMSSVVKSLKPNETMLIIGLGDVPSSFLSYLQSLPNVVIWPGLISEFYVNKKIDKVFLSRVCEHFLPQEHYDNWIRLTKIAKEIICCVPDMASDFEYLTYSLQQDFEHGCISFKTLRTIFEIYSESEFYDKLDRSFHRIYYSPKTFLLNTFLPSGIIMKDLRTLFIDGYQHLEVTFKVGEYIGEPDIKVEFNRNPISITIDSDQPTILDDRSISSVIQDILQKCCLAKSEILIKNLFSNINPRQIDYVLFELGNVVDKNVKITFFDVDKSRIAQKLKECSTIEEYWSLNNKLFNSTPYHCDNVYVDILLTQEFFKLRHPNTEVILVT